MSNTKKRETQSANIGLTPEERQKLQNGELDKVVVEKPATRGTPKVRTEFEKVSQ